MCKEIKNNPCKESSNLHWSKQLVNFLVGWTGLQIIFTIVEIALAFVAFLKTGIFDFNIINENLLLKLATNTIGYLILFSIFFAFNYSELPKLFKVKKVWTSIGAGLICLACIYLFNNFYNNFLTICGISFGDNANEAGIESVVNIYPLVSLLIFGLIGPICEEITYRVGLFSLIRRSKSKISAYIITTIVFAFIHFDFNIIISGLSYGFNNVLINALINELINMPLYLYAAISFTITFERHGFVGSVTAHIANNLLSIGSAIIIGFLQ